MQFYRDEPTARTSWRLAILMGVNTRTYKFALGAALLDLASSGAEAVSLRNLATAYSARMLERPSPASQAPSAVELGEQDFLSVLARERDASREQGGPSELLVDAAMSSMPGMVMQKFHNLRDLGRVAHSFYELEGRGARRVVRFSPELRDLAPGSGVLAEELDSRWSIVEASFDAGIGRGLVGSGMAVDAEKGVLVAPARRVAVTSLRGGIAGFQHGECFYCRKDFASLGPDVHVDHVFPFAWMRTGSWRGPDLNHVWNLVLACAPCNLSKGARPPTEDEIGRLARRNDAIACSPHPLRRTLEVTMGAAGQAGERQRRRFLRSVVAATTDGPRG
ncbi:HNH endonuclease [Lolliginicoccus levis]|uniref:HNH endonuclease n=1 Tax=Lolliginicoccus levis TaxID=2919542 RepID=UPI00241C1680|nr:HNH endonuclease signature motif containing protein [Lolliginicoccus levis]